MKTITCDFNGRTKDAAGVFYDTTVVLDVPQNSTSEEISLMLYAKYEHITRLEIDGQKPRQYDRQRLSEPLQRFSYQFIAEPVQVEQFNQLATRYVQCRTFEANGDPYAGQANTQNKTENARLWGREADEVGQRMEALAKGWGFDHLDFGVGMYPTLQTTSDDTSGTVNFPYE